MPKKDPKPFEWDWAGNCDPAGGRYRRVMFESFSVGCFQWVPKSGGKGLKRSRAVKRFSGPVAKAQEVYARAQAWCDAKNAEARPAGPVDSV